MIYLMNLNFLAIEHIALSLKITLWALCLPDLTITWTSDIFRASPTSDLLLLLFLH